MSLGFEKIIYCNYKDKEQPIHFKPEADLQFPYIFRVYITSLDTGEQITFSDAQKYWAQIPKNLVTDTNEDRVFLKDVEVEAVVDIERLYNKTGLFGAYQIEVVRYNPEADQRAYTEQTSLLVLTDNGIKIGLE